MTAIKVGDRVRWDHGPCNPNTCTETYHVGMIESEPSKGSAIMKTNDGKRFAPPLSELTRLPR